MRISVPLAVLFLLITAEVSAQGMVTPFTKRVVDSTGKEVYVQPQPRGEKRNLTLNVGYGSSPHTRLNSFGNKKLEIKPFYGPPLDTQMTGCFGSFHIGIGFQFNPWLELNFMFNYSSNTGKVMDPVYNTAYYDDFFTLIPNLRIAWLRNNWFTLYSRIGGGLGLGNREMKMDDEIRHTSIWGYQLSPVGIEIGNHLVGAYVEGGYGFTGTVTAGLRFKVFTGNKGKSKEDHMIRSVGGGY